MYGEYFYVGTGVYGEYFYLGTGVYVICRDWCVWRVLL